MPNSLPLDDQDFDEILDSPQDSVEIRHSTEEYEAALAHRREDTYVLRLYVTGSTPQSLRAITTLRRLCERHLAGRYDLEVIDIYQQPERAEAADIVAAPTLIKQLPPPLRRFVGDLSSEERLLVGLDLRPQGRERP
jgi:circadian clock protein KaiB